MAFTLEPVVEGLATNTTGQITSITNYNDQLLLGTEKGQLLVYKVTVDNQNSNTIDGDATESCVNVTTELLETKSAFAKRYDALFSFAFVL